MDSEPLVSIIIPTLNSERVIFKCLKSVEGQTYTNIETIVVDGGSDDRTVQIAKNFGIKIINFNIRSMTRQTNNGVSASIGEYVYRLDSDVILSPTVIEECVQKCEIENYDCIATYWGPDESISFWARVRKLEKDCYKYDLARNVARFYKKDVFKNVGGYNDHLVAGEDYDIQNRLLSSGYKIGFAESEGLHLGEPTSLSQIARKNYYYGKTLVNFLNQNRTKGIVQMSPLRFSLAKNWKKFAIHPFLSFGFLFYEIVVYSSAIAGFSISIFNSIKLNSGYK